MELRHLRPTLEVVGLHSGIDGISAAVPHKARAYVLCRLVTSQMASEAIAQIKAQIEKHLPAGLTVEVNTELPITPAVKYSEDDPAYQIANAVLTDVYVQKPMVGYVAGGVGVLAYMRYLVGMGAETRAISVSVLLFSSALELPQAY